MEEKDRENLSVDSVSPGVRNIVVTLPGELTDLQMSHMECYLEMVKAAYFERSITSNHSASGVLISFTVTPSSMVSIAGGHCH